MRALIVAAAVTIGSLALAPTEAQAWTWGRFYGTGYSQSSGYAPSYYPAPSSAPGYDYYPSYQNYTYPQYNSYSNGYYNNYNLGYGSGLYAPPYRSYYVPGTYYGYGRGY
jgi:hypothetical protein